MAIICAEGDEILFTAPDVDEVRLLEDAPDEIINLVLFLACFAGKGEVLPIAEAKTEHCMGNVLHIIPMRNEEI